MSCEYCNAALQCTVDCPNAPWNHDKKLTTRIGYLKRFVKYLKNCGWDLPLSFRPEMEWMKS